MREVTGANRVALSTRQARGIRDDEGEPLAHEEADDTREKAMIPPVRTDPVWGRAQSGPVQPEGRTGPGPRLVVLVWTGLV